MRALFVRLILLALAPADALADVSSATQRAEEVTIGVRDDARPFIWWDPDTKEYLGFFWDVCTEAVQRAGYRFHEVKVEAGKRADFLITGAGDFDLLCDPTTITLKRMQNFAYDGRAPALSSRPSFSWRTAPTSSNNAQQRRRPRVSFQKKLRRPQPAAKYLGGCKTLVRTRKAGLCLSEAYQATRAPTRRK